jgi:cytochrome c556
MDLSASFRDTVKSRMGAHARDMSDLASAVTLIDYTFVEIDAERIAADDRFGHSTTRGAGELEAAPPAWFAKRQEDLRIQARVLLDDARARDPSRVAADFGKLSETCVRCHADFRSAVPGNRRARAR